MSNAKTVEERNQRLDKLLEATTSWTTRRLKELQDRVIVTKRILKGRTGAERLANSTKLAAQEVVVDAIDDFLQVGS